MTSNIFRVFGILVLLLLIYTVLTWSFNTKDPVLNAVTQFLTVMKQQNRAELGNVIDMSNAEVTFAGDKASTITFKAVNIYHGAFSKRPEVNYSALELSTMQIRLNERPTRAKEEAIASVVLMDGGMIYLRQIGDQWKVFYIDKAPLTNG